MRTTVANWLLVTHRDQFYDRLDWALTNRVKQTCNHRPWAA